MNRTKLILLCIFVIGITIGIIFSSLLRPELGNIDNSNEQSMNVTISVVCDALLGNMDLLERDLHELVPEDGIVFPETIVTAQEGDSVFDVLQREMREAGIHMSSQTITGTNMVFVDSINNLPSGSAGPMSGWLFSVNGESAMVGPSDFILSDGDVVEWEFTLDVSEGWE